MGGACHAHMPFRVYFCRLCSASRIGESDGQVNRKRIKAIRQALEKKVGSGWRTSQRRPRNQQAQHKQLCLPSACMCLAFQCSHACCQSRCIINPPTYATPRRPFSGLGQRGLLK